MLLASTVEDVGLLIIEGPIFEPKCNEEVICGIATSGAYQSTYGGNIDVFIAKFSKTGTCLWATYFGGPDIDNGIDITVDLNDNIYVTGYTLSATGIATNGSHQATFGGGTTYGDAYIVKFSTGGVRLWGTYIGGDADDYGNGIATDKTGNVYMAGYSTSAYPLDCIATSGAFQTVPAGGPDIIVIKFNASGVRQWGTYYGSSEPDYGCKIALDSSGNIGVSSVTYSDTGLVTSGAHQTVYKGNGDALLLKLSPAGTRIWCTYLGGDSYDYGIDLTFDKTGNIFMTGSTNSDSGIASTGSSQDHRAGAGEAYLAKFSPGGSRLWSTYYGGSKLDGAFAITVDPEDNAAITGFTISDSGMVSSLVHQQVFGGVDDIFVARFNAAGAKLWSTYYGGPNADEGNGIASDNNGNIFVTGLSSSTNKITTPGAYKTNYSGGAYDAVLAAFTKNGGLLTIGNNSIAAGQQTCKEYIPAPLTGSSVTGGYNTHGYAWIRSVSGPANGFVSAPGQNALADYASPKLDSNTWFRRVVISGDFMDTSAAIMITVNAKPIAAFSINDSIQCLNENYFIFSDQSVTDAGSLRFWRLGPAGSDTSATVNPAKKFDTPGNYQVKLLRVANTGCMDSIIKTVTVKQNPVKPVITAISNTLLQSSLASAYRWFYNNTYINDSARQFLIINKNGNYFVSTDSSNGCSNTSDILAVTTVGMDDLKAHSGLSVFPNPANDKLFVVNLAGQSELDLKIEIYDLKGALQKLVVSELTGTKPTQIDLSFLPAGIYLLKVNETSFRLIKL